jgi:hypothetical protein
VRLDPGFRRALYAAVAVLTVTGAGWMLADWQKDPAGPEAWQTMAANLLMVHGGTAMIMLMLLGALFPLHVRQSWRSGRNRLSGPTMIGINAALIVTGFGLYYAGSELLRAWISDIHIAAGFVLPALLALHIWVGRNAGA